MKINVTIQRNSDKLWRSLTMQWDDKHADGIAYMWRDGNYSCDCNRQLFFNEADGVTTSDEDVECGEGAYTVISVKNAETGELIYSDLKTDTRAVSSVQALPSP